MKWIGGRDDESQTQSHGTDFGVGLWVKARWEALFSSQLIVTDSTDLPHRENP